MFRQDYDRLNPKQKQVVDELDKNLLVLAPAGTGKTKSNGHAGGKAH